MFTRSIIALSLILIVPALATAEPVRIVSGGTSTAKKLEPIKGELEKAAGEKVEVTINPIDAALIGVSKGVFDAMIGPLDETFESAEKREGKKFNRADFQFFEVSKSALHIGLHPSNPTASLTTQQIKDIMTGKIKTWESINGKKDPIKVVMARNFVAANKTYNRFYLGGDANPTAEMVVNKDGLLGALKANPNAIGFFTSQEKTADFAPKFFLSETSMVSSMIALKKMKPAAQKVYDHLKNNPDLIKD